jgi:predicted DCC family thiol-disulfide oxidoreductase YuxK
VLAAAALALGRFDRAGAVVLVYGIASFVDAGWLAADRGLLAVVVLLVAHVTLPGAPYGSLAARGRVDPRGDWRMPGALRLAVWDLTAFALVFAGATGLLSDGWPGSPRSFADWGARVDLGIGFWGLALAWSAGARRWVWLVLAVWQCVVFAVEPGWSAAGALLLVAFLGDPAWIRPAGAQAVETLYYDGGCGLCHRWVRFVLAEDRGPELVRFAPLGGERFLAEVDADERARLPDSLVLRSADGKLRLRSDGVLHLLARLGGAWRALAIAGRLVPRALRDAAYDMVARRRLRLFARPAGACPVLPAELLDRFDLG